MTNKTTLKRLKLDPYFSKTIETNLNVWSHDQNSYEIKFEFYDHQCNKPIDLTGADMRILLDHVGSQPKIYPLEIESKVLGLAKFIMPEQIRGCEGKFTAHIYADYPNWTHDFGSFTFYTQLSKIDKSMDGCLDTVYVSEFEKALEKFKEIENKIEENDLVRKKEFLESEAEMKKQINIKADKKELEYKADLDYVLSKGKTLELLDSKADKVETENKIDDLERKKADQSFVDAQLATIVSGAPKGTYKTLQALKEAFPNGTDGVFLVLENGRWYYYADGWQDGGVYQSTSIGEGSVKNENIADKTISIEKLNFSPYNMLDFSRANFDVDEHMGYDIHSNLTVIKDITGGINHNYRLYSKQVGLGSAVKVTGRQIERGESTRIFIGKNDSDIIFGNLFFPANQEVAQLDISAVTYGSVKVNVLNSIQTNLTRRDLEKNHCITFRQIGNYLAVYINNDLKGIYENQTMFGSQFIVSGASFRGTLIGNSRVSKIEVENQVTPYMHFSIDDGFGIVADLHNKRDEYTSIFDNPSLKFLKSLRDKYGIVISIYLFQTDGTLDLSTITTKYRKELSDNAHWLKFGFHSKQSGFNYNNAKPEEAVADYKKMVETISRFANASNIDVIPRFENFGMSMECQEALLKANLPFEGTYGADDKRDLTAGLTGDARTLIQNTDYYYNPEKDLFYIHTETRMDKANNQIITDQLNELHNDNSNNLIYGMFWHHGAELRETQRNAIETACQWAINHQVRFDFPQNNKPKI